MCALVHCVVALGCVVLCCVVVCCVSATYAPPLEAKTYLINVQDAEWPLIAAANELLPGLHKGRSNIIAQSK